MKYRKLETHFAHDQKKIPTTNITQNIKRNLKEIITIHYKKHENKKKKRHNIILPRKFLT